MTTNLKSEILDNINNIALGVNTDSSLRNKLLVQLEQAESTNAFDFKIDVNFINYFNFNFYINFFIIYHNTFYIFFPNHKDKVHFFLLFY